MLSCKEGESEFNRACEWLASKSDACKAGSNLIAIEMVVSFLVPLSSMLFPPLMAGQQLCFSLQFILGLSSKCTSALCICACSRVWVWGQPGCRWPWPGEQAVTGVQASLFLQLSHITALTAEGNVVNLQPFGGFFPVFVAV